MWCNEILPRTHRRPLVGQTPTSMPCLGPTVGPLVGEKATKMHDLGPTTRHWWDKHPMQCIAAAQAQGICRTNTQCGAMKHCPGPTVGSWYDKHPMQCMAEAPLQLRWGQGKALKWVFVPPRPYGGAQAVRCNGCVPAYQGPTVGTRQGIAVGVCPHRALRRA